MHADPTAPIRLVLSDVDGTLITPDKQLTARTITAVRALHDAGVVFAITSSRPPRGLAMLVEPLDLTSPLAAFNGATFVTRDMTTIHQRPIRPDVVTPVIELLESFALDVWLYRGCDWYVRNLDGPHVRHEAAAVQFEPELAAGFDGIVEGVVKILGVGDDHDRVNAAEQAAQEAFAHHVSATRSQPYYLDVTHPDANKGNVVRYLSELYEIPNGEIATIGDMPNDLLMFAESGLSIAMGNADARVQRAAHLVTSNNDDAGFADAVEHFILGGRRARRNR